LIDTAHLGQHLGEPQWAIFDCRHDLTDVGRGLRVYHDGHIPGAIFTPVDRALSGRKTGLNGRHPLPAPKDFAAFLNDHGVTSMTQLVAYDDVGGQYAARFWWLVRWIGLTRVGVLDGGLPKWLAEGRPMTTAIAGPGPRGNVNAEADFTRVRAAADVLEGIASKQTVVIDARAPERFRGETEPIDKVAGHIPSARNRFFKTNLNSDLTMRSPQELRREFEALLGGVPASQVIHQCGSGVTACVNLLAMEHAGLSGSKLYAGSWSEWIANPSRPIARG
jgi:thiosulfate/3-mercaptopyruvate sulfurtransferase